MDTYLVLREQLELRAAGVTDRRSVSLGVAWCSSTGLFVRPSSEAGPSSRLAGLWPSSLVALKRPHLPSPTLHWQLLSLFYFLVLFFFFFSLSLLSLEGGMQDAQ